MLLLKAIKTCASKEMLNIQENLAYNEMCRVKRIVISPPTKF